MACQAQLPVVLELRRQHAGQAFEAPHLPSSVQRCKYNLQPRPFHDTFRPTGPISCTPSLAIMNIMIRDSFETRHARCAKRILLINSNSVFSGNVTIQKFVRFMLDLQQLLTLLLTESSPTRPL